MSMHDRLLALSHPFPDEPLDPSTLWGPLGTTYTDVHAFEAGLRGKRSSELSRPFLEQFHDVLGHLAPARLPALVTPFLRAAFSDDAPSTLTWSVLQTLTRAAPMAARFDARFAALGEPQKRAIANVLHEVETHSTHTALRREAASALDSYWREWVEAEQAGDV